MSIDKRAERGMKQATKMFKEIGSGGTATGVEALSGLLMTLAEATGILAPLEAVLDVVKGLLGIMGAEIVPVLMDQLRPLLDILLSMTPVFMVIGQLLGILMQFGWIPMQAIFSVIQAVLTPLLPYFEQLSGLLTKLQPIIDVLVNEGINALITAIWGMGLPIAALIDLFTGGAANAVEGWTNMIMGADTALIGLTGSTLAYTEALRGLDERLSPVITETIETAEGTLAIAEAYAGIIGSGGRVTAESFQTGTRMITRTGPAIVHAGEEVKPAGLVGIAEEYLEELLIETRKAREDAEFRAIMSRF